jgi:DNA-directed RNA polymerase subunit RPC12/RpoP
MKLKCQKCSFEWEYTGSKKQNKKYKQYVACPRCRTSVALEEKNGQK